MSPDPMRARLARQRAELRRLNHVIAERSRYVDACARQQLAQWRRVTEAERRFVETRCPWCRLRSRLRLLSYRGWFWRWRVLLTGGSPGWRMKLEYDKGRRDALNAINYQEARGSDV